MFWFPLAKINLGLAVLNKRPDGYHNIESFLHPIKLYDILEIIEARDKDKFSISGFDLNIPVEENLVWKSLQLMRKHFDFPFVEIHLHKQIPGGAGLGGGSSDAAYTLSGINDLFRLKISKNTITKLSAEIGSDCPFFINNKAAYVKGRGEILESLEIKISALKLLIVIPDFSVSTKIAYDKLDAKNHRMLPKKALEKPVIKWKQFLKNDFETVVFNEFPILAGLKERLYQSGSVYASLSGSGSALYGIFLEEVFIELPENYRFYWLVFPD